MLNPAERTVSREHRSPWSVRTLWSHSGDRVQYVSLSVNAQGIARLEAWLRDGSTLLIERGVNEGDLRSLGSDLARCWGVPFRSGEFDAPAAGTLGAPDPRRDADPDRN
jgi:hypothetical protein